MLSSGAVVIAEPVSPIESQTIGYLSCHEVEDMTYNGSLGNGKGSNEGNGNKSINRGSLLTPSPSREYEWDLTPRLAQWNIVYVGRAGFSTLHVSWLNEYESFLAS